MPSENEFSKPPKGFAFATKYAKDPESVGLFPSQFKDKDVNDLPLEYDVHPHVNRYYFAERAGSQWEISTFDVSEGHGGMTKYGNRDQIANRLLCLGHADAVYEKVADKGNIDDARKQAISTLDACLKSFHLSK